MAAPRPTYGEPDTSTTSAERLETHHGWALVAGTGKRPMVPPGHPHHPDQRDHPDHPDRSARAPAAPP